MVRFYSACCDDGARDWFVGNPMVCQDAVDGCGVSRGLRYITTVDIYVENGDREPL